MHSHHIMPPPLLRLVQEFPTRVYLAVPTLHSRGLTRSHSHSKTSRSLHHTRWRETEALGKKTLEEGATAHVTHWHCHELEGLGEPVQCDLGFASLISHCRVGATLTACWAGLGAGGELAFSHCPVSYLITADVC